jgi:hypothetical protein
VDLIALLFPCIDIDLDLLTMFAASGSLIVSMSAAAFGTSAGFAFACRRRGQASHRMSLRSAP